jgi:hypothetical protein
MTKTQNLAYLEVLTALKSSGCISGHRIEGDDVIPEWLPGGADRATTELISGARPFGLKKSRRGYLMLLLPIENRHKIDELFLDQVRKRVGL